MQRRGLATLRPAVTRPGRGAPIGAGDLVEVQTFEGLLRLGQVVAGSPGGGPDEPVEVRLLGSTPGSSMQPWTRMVKPGFIRFHHACDGPPGRPEAFQQAALAAMRGYYEALQAAVAGAPGAAGLEAVIYEADLARRVFGARCTGAQLYATHMFLYGSLATVRRDIGYRGGTAAYHVRAGEPADVIARAGELTAAQTEQLGGQLYRALYERQPLEPGALLGVAVAALVQYAGESYLNASGPVEHPLFRVVEALTKDVCRPTPADVHRVLCELQLFPLDYDPAESGSGRLLREGPCVPGPVRAAAPPGPEGRQVVSALVLAIDSAATVEVDDAVHFDGDWVHVHVADAGAVAPFGSELERAARSRVSSIYLPQRSIAMLPAAAAAAMSLSPGRGANAALTFSARLGADGAILDYRVQPTLLTAVRRLTYEAAGEALAGDAGLQAGLRLLEGHRAGRVAAGHVPLVVPRPAVRVSEGGARTERSIVAEALPAARLVSEAMLVAGRVAAMHAAERGVALPFRYHLPPAPPDAGLLARVRAPGATRLDTLRLLAALGPSAVDTAPRPHWAMGVGLYARATSPIRRYFDLLLHHQVRATLVPGLRPAAEAEVAALLPALYRHEQYLRHLQLVSTRYWVLRHVRAALLAGGEPPVLRSGVLVLEPGQGRHRVWVESLALVLYAGVLGRPAAGLQTGSAFDARLVGVDPMRGTVELAAL